jgi:chromosomal replication initiation ATPase DnaA
MAKPVQMPLDLGGGPSYAMADFLVADSNREAFSAITGDVAWSSFALALVGPVGSGKSHLAHMFAHANGVVVTSATLGPWIDAVDALADRRVVVIDDADRNTDERALLHLFNLMRERNRTLLLTGRDPPARWPVTLADLRSRLTALPIATIGPPDEAMLAALMVKLFADRQLRVGQELPAYLLPRLERSFAAVRRAVAALDQAALAKGRPITPALAREVLGLGVTPDLWDE